MFGSPNCSFVPQKASTDPGVAGTGVGAAVPLPGEAVADAGGGPFFQVLLSFMITAGIAIVISASLILQEFFPRSATAGRRPGTIRRKLLNGYSDQQILLGIGIQCVGLAQSDTMIPYHFFLIWMLSLLSMAVHDASLLALVHDFRRDWVLRWLRQALMFVSLVLTMVFGAFILRGISRNLAPTLPVACAWNLPPDYSYPDAGFMYFGTVAIILGNCLVFALATWYLHSRTQRFYRAVQLGGLVLMAAIAFGAAARIVLLSQAFGPGPDQLRDAGERVWSFGQLVALLMLLLPLVLVIEIYRGEWCLLPCQPMPCHAMPAMLRRAQANHRRRPKAKSKSRRPCRTRALRPSRRPRARCSPTLPLAAPSRPMVPAAPSRPTVPLATPSSRTPSSARSGVSSGGRRRAGDKCIAGWGRTAEQDKNKKKERKKYKKTPSTVQHCSTAAFTKHTNERANDGVSAAYNPAGRLVLSRRETT